MGHKSVSKPKHKKRHSKGTSLAKQADRHELYELSVQCAESEIDFIDETFTTLRGRQAKILREDFCGTANVCCDWVQRRKNNIAIGIDIDHEVLEWGRSNNLSKLPKPSRNRIQLLEQNVLTAETKPIEIISAMNFSYWDLNLYFQQVYKALTNDGVFFLDAYGGYDSFRTITEKTKIEGQNFTYIWEQEKYDPISGKLICHIHFKFSDGSKLKKAFSYNWRLWTLPEIRELLTEAGFRRVTLYWQGFDENDEPDGDFQPTKEAESDASWICYISAEK